MPRSDVRDDSLTREVLAELAVNRAYPDDPSAGDPSARGTVDWIQTHLSHVFLTGERVYKFRKAVDLDFVCFTSRDERNSDCLREVALNRRLAPDVYLGIAPLHVGSSGARVGPASETLAAESCEHCVVMRRLPEGRDALTLLGKGALTRGQLDRAAVRIAAFHASCGLGRPAPFGPDEWIRRCTQPVEDNYLGLADAPGDLVSSSMLSESRERARVWARDGVDRFEARRVEGRAVDGHGDLHLQHIWFESDDADPVIIDCLEFSERLRHVDAACDVAFAIMDLRYRGHPELADRFARIYAREIDDFGLFGVLDYFVSYRAAVRAKVAVIAAADPEIAPAQRSRAVESARRHLELALKGLEPRGAGILVLVGGVVGTGKSTAAEIVADTLGGVVVSTDRVRKHRLGLEPTQRPDAGLASQFYTPERKREVYEAVEARARPILASGRAAVLDGTFSRREDRRRARRLAAELGVRVFFVETHCSGEVALRRLARRSAEARNPSDAGTERYLASALAFEKLEEWPVESRVRVRTDRGGWRETLRGIVEKLRG